MEAIIALVIFFGVPLMFVAYTGWLIFTGRTKGEPEIYPLGDASETKDMLHNTRRGNHERRK